MVKKIGALDAVHAAPACLYPTFNYFGGHAMFSPMKLLDSMQSEWPLLPSLALVGTGDSQPHWAAASAQRVVTRLSPVELAACRAQLPALVGVLAALHRRWAVTSVLAVVLGLAAVSAAYTSV